MHIFLGALAVICLLEMLSEKEHATRMMWFWGFFICNASMVAMKVLPFMF